MSKGLEALKRIAERMANKEPMIVRDYTNIEEELKALEIIRTKEVNIYAIRKSENLVDYNVSWVLRHKERILTQEEYDLLKEVLL